MSNGETNNPPDQACRPTAPLRGGAFKIGDHVIYRGRTYTFPGEVCGVTDDGQVIVRALGAPDGSYAGMKHIYGPSQLERIQEAEGEA